MKWNKIGDGSSIKWGQSILLWNDNAPVLIKTNDVVTIGNGNTATHWAPVNIPTIRNGVYSLTWLSHDIEIPRSNEDKYVLIFGYSKDDNRFGSPTHDLFLTKWVKVPAWPSLDLDNRYARYHMENESLVASWYCFIDAPEEEPARVYDQSDNTMHAFDHLRLVIKKESVISHFPSVDFYHEVRRLGYKVSRYTDGSFAHVYHYQNRYYDTRECIVQEPGKLALRFLNEHLKPSSLKITMV